MKLYERVARHMFEVQRLAWIKHPNILQAKKQAEYEQSAKALINRINEWCGSWLDPELELGSPDPIDKNFRARIGGLALIQAIQGALGTEETGAALVEVARNAHTAEQAYAARERIERGD